MNYNVEELLFLSATDENEPLYVWAFLKRDDPAVTRLEVPAEHNGVPVAAIFESAFVNCPYLREIYIPDSVTLIEHGAFENCPELREIRLPKQIAIGAFLNCPKIPPKVVLAEHIGNAKDITAPFKTLEDIDWDALLRPEVFELIVKYNSFREIGTEMLFKEIVSRGLFSHFKILENAGLTLTAEDTDTLIEYSTKKGKTEMTAYLLDLKNRKFGFNGGGDLEL